MHVVSNNMHELKRASISQSQNKNRATNLIKPHHSEQRTEVRKVPGVLQPTKEGEDKAGDTNPGPNIFNKASNEILT